MLAGVVVLPHGVRAASDDRGARNAQWRPPMRPHLLVTARKVEGLRSVEELRRLVKDGHGLVLWNEIKRRADADLGEEPLWVKPGDRWLFPLCDRTAARVMRHALAFLVTGKEAYKDAALAQMEITFDTEKWPAQWREPGQAANLPAGLRLGQLCTGLGLAYDWIHSGLTLEQRARVVAGIDAQGIQPYLQTVENGNWQVNVLDNFCSCISGGVGIAAMALADDLPDFERVMFETKERMAACRSYLSASGPEGEWPESVFYSGSYINVVRYFAILHYWSSMATGKPDKHLVASHPLPQFCRWLMYVTLPHARMARFGNCGRWKRRIALSFVPAVAEATRDGVLQWYYLNNLFSREETRLGRHYTMELLGYDPNLEPVDPEGHLPRGHAFAGTTMCASSRADWNPVATPCVVYGKAGAAYETHGHHDVGQVCIDGYGDLLIVDAAGYHLGGRTPERDSYAYYKASSHNVLTFDGKDMVEDRPTSRACYKLPTRRTSPALRSKLLASSFDDERGGYWVWDTSDVYEDVREVRRTVVHLDPGVVVVLDTADLPKACDVALRWHTAGESRPDPEGRFLVRGHDNGTQLACRVVRLDEGDLAMVRGNDGKFNSFIDAGQKHEAGPYVRASLHGSKCEILSLFCVFAPETPPARWEASDGAWSIETPSGVVDVCVSGTELSVLYRDGRRGWCVQRQRLLSDTQAR